LPISFLNFEIHGLPTLLWAPGQRFGCTPLSWGLWRSILHSSFGNDPITKIFQLSVIPSSTGLQ